MGGKGVERVWSGVFDLFSFVLYVFGAIYFVVWCVLRAVEPPARVYGGGLHDEFFRAG